MQQTGDLEELKTELGAVVEVLSVLHEFIDSVFGVKYQSFLGGGEDNNGSGSKAKSVEQTLRRLRGKHCGGDGGFGGAARRESRADHGYASAGGTPVGGLMAEEKERQMTFGDLEKRMMGEVGNVGVKREEGEGREEEEEDGGRFSVSVGRSEVVAVKCEVEADVDFLDDMDPFGNDQGDYHYEGDDLQIDSCYTYDSPHLTSEAQNIKSFQESSPIESEPIPTSTSRYLPELIPIKQDPSMSTLSTNSTHNQQQQQNDNDNDVESVSVSSGEDSDTEWKPTSVSSNTGFSKRPRNPKVQQNRNNNYPSNHTFQRHPQQQQQQPPFSADCLFKCDLCPATYKQEDSLRSHQKYKHNPSRVVCTCHLCGKTMVDKYRLQRHLRLHTGEKPFECEYCGQSFYRKDYHTKHLQRKHGISYNSVAVNSSKLVKKPKSSISSTSSSSSSTATVNSGSSPGLCSLTQAVMNSMFETPASPQRKSPSSATASYPLMTAHLSNRPNNLNPTISSPYSSSSPDNNAAREHKYTDYFFSSTHSSGQAEEASMNNLMTMTNLTFDDLISADL